MRLAAWFVPAVLLLVAPARASADGLAPDEAVRLDHGDTVSRATTVDDGDHRYVGGVASMMA